MNRVFLGLGSNVGDRYNNLISAIKNISEVNGIIIIQMSSIYETKPFGLLDQKYFLNMVIEIDTELNSNKLLETVLNIEKKMGRERKLHWGPRNIDIDILIYGNKIINEKNLIIPHPYMNERLFVLIPLAEIYNGKIPNTNKSIVGLIDNLKSQKGDVKKWGE